MIEYGHIALRQFPKYERHVLGAEIRQSMWSLLRLVIQVHKRYFKKTSLQDLDAELDVLRSQIRMAKQLGHIDFKKYEFWSKLNDEIGKMIGGWIRNLTSQKGSPGGCIPAME